MSTTQDSAASGVLCQALRRLLRPLVRALIEAGLTFPTLMELIRGLYVEVARDEFGIAGKPPTHSRIALLSGVHRKEIRRLLASDPVAPAPSPSQALGAKVIALWTGAPAWLDEAGQPQALARGAVAGAPSFEALVAAVSKDVRPRTLLDEWLRQGVVELDGERVRLRVAAFGPRAGYADKAFYFGRNVGEHIAAAAHNLAGQEPPLFDRAVYYDRLRPDSLAELRGFVAERAMALLLEVNRRAAEHAARDRAGGAEPAGRFTLGAYFYAEPAGSPPADAAERDG